MQKNNTKLLEKMDLFGLKMDSVFLDLINKYYEFLNLENQKYNLTSIDGYQNYIDFHILDSLSVFMPINYFDIEYGSIADLGTGAGFPGLPIKIAKKQISLSLIDSTNKKIKFLTQLVDLLELQNVQVINSRIENLVNLNDQRGNHDLILSRAVGKLSTLIEISLPLLKKDGHCIFHKSNLSESEYDSLIKTIKFFNAQLIEIYKIPFDLTNRERVLVIVKKINDIDNKYPRSNNKPFRKPLF
tara:strand:+ start:631 stop:1359 length:729 start_codon:yes stop_codon:yes gene_type:complete